MTIETFRDVAVKKEMSLPTSGYSVKSTAMDKCTYPEIVMEMIFTAIGDVSRLAMAMATILFGCYHDSLNSVKNKNKIFSIFQKSYDKCL